jgi:thiamine phosphate synthase YjbQ (UPF0047 family)
MIRRIAVETTGQGLYEFTSAVQEAVRGANIAEGLCTAGGHPSEGADDMPSHIKAALTATSLSIPADGALALGIWQGIYLWEHRRRGSRRDVVLHIAT